MRSKWDFKDLSLRIKINIWKNKYVYIWSFVCFYIYFYSEPERSLKSHWNLIRHIVCSSHSLLKYSGISISQALDFTNLWFLEPKLSDLLHRIIILPRISRTSNLSNQFGFPLEVQQNGISAYILSFWLLWKPRSCTYNSIVDTENSLDVLFSCLKGTTVETLVSDHLGELEEVVVTTVGRLQAKCVFQRNHPLFLFCISLPLKIYLYFLLL